MHYRRGGIAGLLIGSMVATLGLSAGVTGSAAAQPPQPRMALIDPQLRAQETAMDAPVEYLVSLPATPDLAAVTGDRDAVVAALKATAAASQQPVVEHVHAHGGQVVNTFWLANAVLVRSTAGIMHTVTTVPGVRAIEAVATYQAPEPERSTQQAGTATVDDRTWGVDRVGAHRVWDELGVDGAGIRVATLDTGVDADHPDLARRLATDDPADPTHPGGWMEFDAAGNPVESTPHDSQYHGTHVAGTIHGGSESGTAIGVAPGAAMMHGLVLPGGGGTWPQVVAGMQWAVEPYDYAGNPAGAPAHVVNMSLGPQSGGIVDDLVEPVRNLHAAGVMPVTSAGNCGEECHGSPGNVFESLATGATDDDDDVAGFSSGGVVRKDAWTDPPSDWPQEWTVPDLSAPGVSVRSAYPGGLYLGLDGTSMASPHLAGTVALMRSGDPSLSLAQIEATLVDTAFFDDRHGSERPNRRFGHGRIDAFQAVAQAVLDSGVAGRVTDAGTGDPAAGVVVEVAETGAMTRTGPDGGYDLRLTPGTYTLTFAAFGYEAATVSEVDVIEDRVTSVDVDLDAVPTGAITGTVTLSTSDLGVPGVPVSVPGTPIPAVTTDGSGQFRITDVPAGTYTVTAQPATFPQPASIAATVEPDAETAAAFTVRCGQMCPPTQQWQARYEGEGPQLAIAQDVGVGPDGDTVYVTGLSQGSPESGTGDDFATVAYDTATGDEVWVSRYDGPASGVDAGSALGLSPDGAIVYVFGSSTGAHGARDFATVAYEAATGDEVWVSRYDGPGDGSDFAEDLAVSPDGDTVYVTGRSAGDGTGDDFATVAYDAATGEQRWAVRYDPDGGLDQARHVEVSPDGSLVYVTGLDFLDGDRAFATVAYDAVTGEPVWVERHLGEFGGTDRVWALAVGPDGTVYASGDSAGASGRDFLTVAYDGDTGDQQWVARYETSCASTSPCVHAVAVSPDGGRVFVTGDSPDGGPGDQFVTLAYDADSGDQQWVARHSGPGEFDAPADLAVSPDGDTVYVTGQSRVSGTGTEDVVTVAYDAASGDEQWLAREAGSAGGRDTGNALAVSPDGTALYVVGSVDSVPQVRSPDYLTLAYDTEVGDGFAVFVPHDLRVQPELTVDSAVQVGVAVANVGVVAGEHELTLLVGDEPADGATVSLAPGESTEVGWTVDPDGSGAVPVQVGHLAGAFRVPDCDTTVTGAHPGPLEVTAGVTCLAGDARVVGPVTVASGAGLIASGASVTGPVTATGAAVVELHHSRLTGPVTITGTTGRLVLAGNQVSGVVRLADNRTGADPIVVGGNRIIGRLSCSGNVPAPVDGGDPNVVTGARTGQCDSRLA